MIATGPRRPICFDELNFLYEGLRLPIERKLGGYIHATLLYEIAAAIESCIYACLKILGRVKSPVDYLIFFQLHLPAYSAIVRGIAAIAGLACIRQVYRLGAILGGEAAAEMAVILCAGNLTFLVMTSSFKEDVFYWFFLFLALEQGWKASRKQNKAAAIAAGVGISAAFSAKYLGIFAALVAFLPFAYYRENGLRQAARVSMTIALSAASTLLVLFPFLLTDTHKVLASLKLLDAHTTAQSAALTWDTYLRLHLPNTAGWAIMALGTAEMIRKWAKDPRGPILLTLIPLITLFFIARGHRQSFAYYSMPLVMLLMVLACELLVRELKALAPVALISILLVDPAYFRGALKYAMLLTAPDTRILARDLIQSKADPGDCVLLNMGVHGENIFGPALTPNNTPPGHGPFSAASVIANKAKPGPKYALRVVDWDEVPPQSMENCRWLAIGRRGTISRLELKELAQDPRAAPDLAFGGFKRIGSVEAFPDEHSSSFPLLTVLDYEDFRRASIADFWKRRALGLSFDLYQRQPGG